MADDTAGKSRRSSWIGGVILVFLGVLFLLQNIGWLARDGNWWAVFILIPAFVLLSTAYTTTAPRATAPTAAS